MNHFEGRRNGKGATRGGENAGRRGMWGGSRDERKHAAFFFERRQKRKMADALAAEDDKVKAAARKVLEETYGGTLPVGHRAAVPVTPVYPEIAPTILTSKDPVELMRDMELLAKAAAEEWPIPGDVKRLAVARVTKILSTQEGIRPELYLKAVEVLAKLDNLNAKWVQTANPQKHEHVHVELERPSVEQQRAAILEFIRINGERAGITGAARIARDDDGGQCLDVGSEPA